METQSHKYFEDDDITVVVEFNHPYATLHVDIRKWTPSVARKGYQVFARLCVDCENNNLTMITFTPNRKFCELFGGKAIGYIQQNDLIYEVVVWDSKP